MSVRYDYAVVGSSPLLLMVALQMSRMGRSVVLFESEDRLGGAWQLEDVDGVGPVECACHLIEWYSGGYELLEKLSGTRFVASDPQPVRVTIDGKVTPYTSRVEIARKFYGSVRGFCGAFLRMLSARRCDRAEKRDVLRISWRDLLFFFRYRLPGVLIYDAIRRPADGYIGFVATLGHQVEVSDIDIVRRGVERIEVRGTEAALFYGDIKLLADKVYIGQSTITGGLSDKIDVLNFHTEYYHIVVSLPAEKVRLRSDYVHLPDDVSFHRITYVRDCIAGDEGPVCFFLVQLRSPLEEIYDFDDKMDFLLARCGIADSAEGLVIQKIFSKGYVRGSQNSSYSSKNPVVHRLRTVGDLSRNLLFHKKLFKNMSGDA